MDGVEFAALYTLQDGLARDAERVAWLRDGEPACGRLFDEASAELVIDADAPWGAGRVLFAGDEALADPAVHGRGNDTEQLGGLGDRDRLAVGLSGRCSVAGNAAVAT